jgi:streptogramin lyase
MWAAIGLLLAFAGSAFAQGVQLTINPFPVPAAGQSNAQSITLTPLVDDIVIQYLNAPSGDGANGGTSNEYQVDPGTCTVGTYVAAGTSCTFSIGFYPQAAGYAQSPAPIGRWSQLQLVYTDQVYGGVTYRLYPLIGSNSRPTLVGTPGIISDIVGNDVTPHIGFGGDGGPLSGATFAQPSAIAMDVYGNLYIAESGSSVVRIVYQGGVFQYLSNLARGSIYTIAGVAPTGGVSHAGPGTDVVIATQSPLNNPTGLAVDSLGNVYIADSGNNAVRMVSANSSGYIFTAAGTLNAPNGYAGDGGQATSAQLANPSGVVVDGYSNLYIADNGNNAIRVVYQGGVALANLIATENPGMTAVAGNIYTIAGGPANAAQPANGDGGLATLANLNGPAAVTVDSSGNIYIADYSNSAVRRVDAVTGNISSVASGIDNPTSLAVDASDSIYFTGHSYCSIQQYNPSLQAGLATPYLTTVAGNGICMASGDGNGATNAGLSGAEGVVVDGMGNLYLLESDGVRFVNATLPILSYGNTNIATGAGLAAVITDDNILPAAGTGPVVDFLNPSFQLTYNRPQYFSIGSFLSANPNILDCNAVPPVYPYLSPGASCGVQVQFEPQTDGGPYLGSAYQPSVITNTLPAVLALSGSGIGTLTTVTLTGASTPFVADLNESTSPPQMFVLTNTGSTVLYATGIGVTFPSSAANGYFYSTNTCTIQNYQYVLQPGSSCQITVGFTATSVGTVTAALTVTDNASTGGGVQTLPLNGTVVAPLGEFVDSTGTTTASASSAPTTPGSSSSFTVNFTNVGTAILNISPGSWAIHGANQSSFNIASTTCGTTLAVFASCNLTINFVPTPLIYGTYTAVLTVQDDSGGQPLNNGNHTYIQQSLNLVGPTTPLPAQTSSFSLQNAAFPAEPIGSSITQTVTLVLNDASNVQMITTAAGSEYSVGTYAPCSGPAGTTCAVSITFTPTGIGARPGTLIVGNLESGVAVPYLLSMTGTGSGALASLTPGIITTVVGGEGGQSLGIVGANGPAMQAQVGSLSDFAMDTAGNMFLADQQNEVIWKVDTTGQAFVYAGTPLPSGVTYQQRMYGDGGAALGSDLAYIGPIALDARGGLYVGDYDEVAYDDQPRIRYIDPSTHIINTVVGYLTPYFWQANSEFFGGLPLRVVVNGTAYRYLAPGNGVSGTTTPAWPTALGSTVQDGTITWINEGLYTATNGCAAETDALGNGCAAEDVQIGTPIGLAIDSGGNLYFSEGGLQNDVTVGNSTTETETQHSAIRRVDAQTGIVTLIAGNGTFGYSPDGTLATQANIQARALAFDNEGNLYFVDAGLYVRKIDKTTGVLSTVTGNATTTNNNICGAAPGEGGSAIGVPYSLLSGISFDAADNLYIADSNACVVRRIDAATQTIHTVAGMPNAPFPLTNTGYGDLGQPNSDGSALEAELSSPAIVRLDGLGNIYIASFYGGVRKVDVSKSVLPFAGPYGQSTYTQMPFTVSAPLTATVLNAGNSGNLQFSSPFISPSWGINQNYFIRDITDPTGSPDCYDLELIAPGNECPINVDFVPQASSPNFVYAQDSVTDNAPTSPQVIQLSGIGFGPLPAVTLTPSIVSVFTPQSGVSAAQPLTLTNNTNSPVTINGIHITGPGAGSFSQTNNCGAQLAANSSCTIEVTFSPSYGTGTAPDNQKATVNVAESADSAPQVAQLIGVGTTPANGILYINEAVQLSEGMPAFVASPLLPINETINLSEGTPAFVASQVLPINETINLSEGTPAYVASQVLPINETINLSEGTPAFIASAVLPINETISLSEGTPTLTASAVLPINETITLTDSPVTPVVLIPTTCSLRFANLTGEVSFTVLVRPTVATGTISLNDGAVPIASGPLVDGLYSYTSSLSPGLHQILGTYGGNATYAACSTGSVPVTVQATLTVTAQSTQRAFGKANPALLYQISGFVNGDTAAVVSGTPYLSTAATLNSPAGAYSISIAQGNISAPSYYSFNFAPGTLTVNATNPQQILFLLPSTISLANATLTLTSHASSSLPVVYQVTGPATLNHGNRLTLTGTGTVTVTATQPGNATFSAAPTVVQNFEVTP